MMLPPGLRAQCEILTNTCVGAVILGFGRLDFVRMFDGRPALACVQASIVSASDILRTQ
jgi:hypothetical protein